MCTAMNFKMNYQSFFGRTMDFSFELDPELYVVYKGYTWPNLLKTHTITTRYTFMGIGQDISPITFADGMNEVGFAAAVLYFPGYAEYDTIDDQSSSALPIAATELTKFLLGTCANVDEAAAILPTIRIIGLEDSVTHTIAPLHWIIADKSGKCLVIEKTEAGLQMIDNPIGVLSNSPDFQWHLTNLRNYLNITPTQNEEMPWGEILLKPFGQGAGTFGLPGDYTPPSRFIRVAYQKTHILPPQNKSEAINACFHIMESVTIPKGIVMTSRGTSDYSQYTAFMDLASNEYYFKSYNNPQILSVKLPVSSPSLSNIVSLGKIK